MVITANSENNPGIFVKYLLYQVNALPDNQNLPNPIKYLHLSIRERLYGILVLVVIIIFKIKIMITSLIYIFLIKYSKQSRAATSIQISKFLSARFRIIFVSLIIPLLLIPVLSKTQNLQLNYKIIQGGDDIGWLRLEKNIVGNKSNLLLVSQIKTRIIFLITVFAKELSTFENAKLIYSSQFRKTNGNIKLDKQTKLVDDKYEVLENGEKKKLALPVIGTNLLSLYFKEPVGINSVYCDNQQRFAKITKTDDGGYKVKFPDGNSNCYYYSEGICTKIKIYHTFYSAVIVLKP